MFPPPVDKPVSSHSCPNWQVADFCVSSSLMRKMASPSLICIFLLRSEAESRFFNFAGHLCCFFSKLCVYILCLFFSFFSYRMSSLKKGEKDEISPLYALCVTDIFPACYYFLYFVSGTLLNFWFLCSQTYP